MQVSWEIKQKLRELFEFYENDIIPVLRSIPEVTQTDYGRHWFYTHTDSVVFRWIYYSLCLNENPIPVIFACACHDIARTDDEYNEIHWESAVPIVRKLMDQFSDILTDAQKESVIYAVKNHTTWMSVPDYVPAPDYVSACLWDADRTRLWWIYWYQEKFMSTDESKRIALLDPIDFLKFQNECLWRDLSEDREWILEYSK